MTDLDLMPFGDHKGKRLSEVPDAYKLFLWNHFFKDYKSGSLKTKQNLQKVMVYIETNLGKIKNET